MGRETTNGRNVKNIAVTKRKNASQIDFTKNARAQSPSVDYILHTPSIIIIISYNIAITAVSVAKTLAGVSVSK